MPRLVYALVVLLGILAWRAVNDLWVVYNWEELLIVLAGTLATFALRASPHHR